MPNRRLITDGCADDRGVDFPGLKKLKAAFEL